MKLAVSSLRHFILAALSNTVSHMYTPFDRRRATCTCLTEKGRNARGAWLLLSNAQPILAISGEVASKPASAPHLQTVTLYLGNLFKARKGSER